MRKGMARKALCIALAAALMLGDAAPAFAASGSTDAAAVQETVVETAAELPDTSEEISEEVTEESTEEVTGESTEEVTEESTEEVTEEISEEVTEESTEEVTEEISEEVTEESTEETTEESTEATAELAGSISSSFSTSYKNGQYVYSAYVSGTSYRAELLVNDVVVATRNIGGGSTWSIENDMYIAAGAKYEYKVNEYDEDGACVTTTLRTYEADAVKLSDTNPVVSLGTQTDEKGYNRPSYVLVSAWVQNSYSSAYGYQILRATKSGGPYTKIYEGTKSGTGYINFSDSSIKAGTRYYYKVRLVTATDEYVKTKSIMDTSAGVRITVGVPTAQVHTSVWADNPNKPQACLSMSSNIATSYDIYRSTSRTSGFKKLKTVYANSYIDKTIKAGATYYYKVVPKYYDPATKKTTTGSASDVAGVKYVLTGSYPSLTQTGNTTVKAEWGVTGASGVSYEVWIKRYDITGDGFKKVATTRSGSAVLKNLVAGAQYSVAVRTVKKSGSVVQYEMSETSYIQLGYKSSVSGLGATILSSAYNKNTTNLVLRAKLTWDRDWGASGYIINGVLASNGKTVRIAKLTSGKTTSYTLSNSGIMKSAGLKYAYFTVTPYKGKSVGVASDVYVNRLPSPKSVKAARASASAVKITWSAVAGATGYTIYKETEIGTWRAVGVVSAATSYVDKNVANNLMYTYEVSPILSMNGNYLYGGSAYSAGYRHKLGTPSIKAGSNSAAGCATISWGAVTNASSYVIYRSTSKNGTYKKVGASTATRYTDKKLTKGKVYYYKVVARCVNEGGRLTTSAGSAVKAVRIRK